MFILSFLFVFFIYKTVVYSACPVCILVAGGTFWLSKKFNITDLSSGIFISSILVSSSQFFGYSMAKRVHNIIPIVISYFLHFASVFLFYENLVEYKLNTLFNIDIFLFGIIVGFFTSIFAMLFYNFIKKLNNNKAHFSYEKIVIYVLFNLVAVFFCSKIFQIFG